MSADQPARPDEVPLSGGRMTRGITRRGGRLLRPMGPGSAAVHAYLRHLEGAGFAGAPRFLGTEGDREVLTFVEGEVACDPDWRPGHGHRLPPYARSAASLAAAGALLARLHRASAGFRPPDTGFRYHPHPPRGAEIVSHGDLGPWNTVYREGLPVAFIDWDAAGPVEPLLELAAAAWAFVPLAPAERLREAGFSPPPDLPARLRLFLDAYGLTDRRSILPALWHRSLHAVQRTRYWPLGPAGTADVLRAHAEDLYWLESALPTLRRAL